MNKFHIIRYDAIPPDKTLTIRLRKWLGDGVEEIHFVDEGFIELLEKDFPDLIADMEDHTQEMLYSERGDDKQDNDN